MSALSRALEGDPRDVEGDDMLAHFAAKDWKPETRKGAKNLAKHGIDFEAAQRMWDNSKTVTLTAPNPGNDDVRYIVLGMIDGKHWTAITTKRGKRIRIISVRRSRKNEEAYYDSQD